MRGRRDPGPGSGRGRAGADRGGTRPWPDRCGRGVRRRPSMELQNQVKELARGYVRKGGKDNRRQQLARMLAFAAHVEAAGASGMGQVGGRRGGGGRGWRGGGGGGGGRGGRAGRGGGGGGGRAGGRGAAGPAVWGLV